MYVFKECLRLDIKYVGDREGRAIAIKILVNTNVQRSL